MSSSFGSRLFSETLTPFLYPSLDSAWPFTNSLRRGACRLRSQKRPSIAARRQITTSEVTAAVDDPPSTVDVTRYDHLDPVVPDYTANPFTDSCTITLTAGAGGHGCISFLREKYVAHGPPNGGDGGTGGNVYIQAVHGETSLHKLARRGILKAERGKNGEGGARGGKRGEDVLVQVPVGTVVREISRHDPIEAESAQQRNRGFGRDLEEDNAEDGDSDQSRKWRRDKWLLYPGTLPKYFTSAQFPALPRPRRSNLTASQPQAPLRLDLDKPMTSPLLLAAGAMGGLGNPHFVTKSVPRPQYATKGEEGLRIQVQLELKLLADVGLVGLPNAGKSTLLRALTKSRTRIGNWAFTTLSPNIGTVVLDSHLGRPTLNTAKEGYRDSFTIADIPGLIEDAHLDRGLGLGFLRHIERAAVLAFVVDLSAGDAVTALKGLWREVGEYEKLREQELNAETERLAPVEDGLTAFKPFESSISPGFDAEPINEHRSRIADTLLAPQTDRSLPPLSLPPISSKPWFVVATKADVEGTQENFLQLQTYLQRVQSGEEEHPSSKTNAWRKRLFSVPVSALRKEGVAGIPDIVLQLLAE